MTQLLIAGVQAVLPQNFQVTVKRENSFFTKSGEYTYDCTLRLDNPVNLQLYGFLNRTNKQGQLDTGRAAVLIADGHVYCRGTEVVTRWTQETVTIQIVSGESELNYFIGQDRKMEELNLGTVTDDDDCAYPVIKTPSDSYLNIERVSYQSGMITMHRRQWVRQVPQPYLTTVLDRTLKALGYTVGTNQLEDTCFKHLFLVNVTRSNSLGKMLAGWTVKDFLTEVERLTGVVFVTDNIRKTCDILVKTQYYLNARQLALHNVTDAYETEVDDEDNRESEFTASNVSYSLPSGRWAQLMKVPEYLPSGVWTQQYASLQELVSAASGQAAISPTFYEDTSTGRRYIRTKRDYTTEKGKEYTFYFMLEADQFADLERDDTTNTLELKITPAPLAPTLAGARVGLEFIDLGTTDSYFDFLGDDESSEDSEDTEPDDGFKETFEETIREAAKDESSAADLYCAFWNGGMHNGFPIPYTDAYHATVAATLYGYERPYDPGSPEGSLRLQDLDSDYYQGGYQIDTRHPTTFETFDPNVIDTRQVYVIRNRRYVVRDTEEVITARGRQKKWKLTVYPIEVSDEAIEKRWVLTKGVWDDGAAWLDDGRWNDE